MKFKDRKAVTSFSLSKNIHQKMEILHSGTLLTRTQIVELLIQEASIAQVKRLVNKQSKTKIK